MSLDMDFTATTFAICSTLKAREAIPKRRAVSWVQGTRRPPALSTYTLAELTDQESTQRRLLVVILNVHIDHMYRLTRLLLSGI